MPAPDRKLQGEPSFFEMEDWSRRKAAVMRHSDSWDSTDMREVRMALRGFKLLVILSLLCLSGVSAQEVERDPGGIFSEGQTTKLFDEAHFTEGPAMGPDGLLYFSDITWTAQSGMQAGHIWRLDPATRAAVIFRSPSGLRCSKTLDSARRCSTESPTAPTF